MKPLHTMDIQALGIVADDYSSGLRDLCNVPQSTGVVWSKRSIGEVQILVRKVLF